MVEILLGVSVLALAVTALAGAIIYGQQSTALSGTRMHATFLAEEGLEAVRNIRDDDFANLTDGAHGLAISGGQWDFSGSSDTNDIFTRQITVSSLDATTKEITSQVDWSQNLQRDGSIALTTLLTNWMLVTAGPGDWSNPGQEAALDLSGNNDGWKIQTVGNYAYVIMVSGGPNFLVIDISNPATPVIVGGVNLAGTARDIAVSGNYAYVASTQNNQELQIVDISNPVSPTHVGSYNAAGNADAQGVFAIGSTVYLVTSSRNPGEFFIINAAVPTLPVAVGTADLGTDQNNEVVVIGNYAYVAAAGNSSEMKVVNISVPALPTLVTSVNLSGVADGLAIAGSGSTIFLGRDNGDFTVINVTVPASPSVLTTLSTTGAVRDISLGNSDTYAFLATDDDNAEFKVIDISSPASPSLLSSFDQTGNNNLYGVAYNDTHDRAFVVGDSDTEEFLVLAPQ